VMTLSPNILFIAVDDLNDWVGVMGGHPQAKTPHIDRLASEGILFANAHCQAPICTPSRTSLLTGLAPTTTGVYMLTPSLVQEIETTRARTLLPNYFAQHGYHTMGIGKILHSHWEGLFKEDGGQQDAGPFRALDDKLAYPFKSHYHDWGAFPESDEEMPDHQSTQWAIERLNRSYENPFFLGVGFHRPHLPMYVPQKWFDLHPLEAIQVPELRGDELAGISERALKVTRTAANPTHQWMVDNGQWAHAVQSYLASVSFLDHCVGQLLDALRASKHAENTVVVLWADHGWHLGEKERWAKTSLWEESTHVPLIFSGPGVGQGVCAEAVQLLDIFPTLLSLAGLPTESSLEGNDLTPLLREPTMAWPHPAVTSYGMHNHSVRTRGWRLIEYNNGDLELYHHPTDPRERSNLAGDPAYSETVARLRRSIPREPAPCVRADDSPWDPDLFD